MKQSSCEVWRAPNELLHNLRSLVILGCVILLCGCSGLERARYYSPSAPDAELSREEPPVDGSSLWGAPDRVVVRDDGFVFALSVENHGGWLITYGPIFLPIIPVFPVSWMFSDDLHEDDILVRCLIMESIGPVKIAIDQTTLEANDGRVFTPDTDQEWWNDGDHAFRVKSYQVDTLRIAAVTPSDEPRMDQGYTLYYRTANDRLDEFTVHVRGIWDNGRLVSLPPIRMEKSSGMWYRAWVD